MVFEKPFHANTKDIKYSQEDAAALARAFDDASHKLGDFQGKIRSEGMHAAQEFRGRYATLFVLNYGQCMEDAHRLADACHRAAEAVRKIAQAAQQEEENRRRAKEQKITRYLEEMNGQLTNNGVMHIRQYLCPNM